jgi:acetyl esterase
MNLDPEVRHFLDELRAGWAAHPPFASLSYPEQRRVADAVRARWNEGGPEMVRTVERKLDPGAGLLRIRLHVPEGVSTPAPTLVYLHGGGFTLFSIDSHDRLMREYAQAAGVAVLGVDYPLAPEHKYPIALDRVEALLLWLKANGVELGIDATRLALGGDSAGANMSFGIVQRLLARGERDLVRAILANYGGYDSEISDEAEERFGGPDAIMSRAEAYEYYANYLNGDDQIDDPHVYALKGDLTGFPPVFLVTPACDILTEHGIAMDAHLRSFGVDTRSKVYPGAIHGFLEAMSVSAVAREALADGAAFVCEQIGSDHGTQAP